MKIWRNHSQLNRILKKNAILFSNLSKRLVFDKNTNLRGSVDLLSTHSLVPTNRLKCTGRCLASKSGKMSWVSYACSCPHKLCRSCPWIVPCNVSILDRFYNNDNFQHSWTCFPGMYMILFPPQRGYHHNLWSTDGLSILASWLEIVASLVHYQPVYNTPHTQQNPVTHCLPMSLCAAGRI